MTLTWQIVLLFVGSYLLGAVPFGLLVARAKGVDIRSQGSGNVGATNVGRVLGKKWGVLVFLLDVSKGAACTLAAGFMSAHAVNDSAMQRDMLWLGAAFCAVAGNVAPIYLNFRGGKGVATSLGTILGIYPYLTYTGLIAAILWLVVVKGTRYVSLGSIVAVSAVPVIFIALSVCLHWGVSSHLPLLGLCCLLAVLVLLRHRDNLRRLFAGTENKFGRQRD